MAGFCRETIRRSIQRTERSGLKSFTLSTGRIRSFQGISTRNRSWKSDNLTHLLCSWSSVFSPSDVIMALSPLFLILNLDILFSPRPFLSGTLRIRMCSSFSCSFETGKMWTNTVSLRTGKKISNEIGASRVRRSFSFAFELGKMWAKTFSLRTGKKFQTKSEHPRVRRSFSFAFETGEMWAVTVSLRTGKKISSGTGAP